MGRAASINTPRPGNQRASKVMGTKRPEKLKVFVKKVNKELEDIEHLILEFAILSIRKT